jgi:hypothetical protein
MKTVVISNTAKLVRGAHHHQLEDRTTPASSNHLGF